MEPSLMSRVVKAPDQFDFVSSWEKFRKLSGLQEEEETKQITMLFYTSIQWTRSLRIYVSGLNFLMWRIMT